MTTPEKCNTCRFMSPEFEFDHSDGDCRRHAPFVKLIVTTNEYEKPKAVWPRVQSNHWCGDFELRKSHDHT